MLLPIVYSVPRMAVISMSGWVGIVERTLPIVERHDLCIEAMSTYNEFAVSRSLAIMRSDADS